MPFLLLFLNQDHRSYEVTLLDRVLYGPIWHHTTLTKKKRKRAQALKIKPPQLCPSASSSNWLKDESSSADQQHRSGPLCTLKGHGTHWYVIDNDVEKRGKWATKIASGSVMRPTREVTKGDRVRKMSWERVNKTNKDLWLKWALILFLRVSGGGRKESSRNTLECDHMSRCTISRPKVWLLTRRNEEVMGGGNSKTLSSQDRDVFLEEPANVKMLRSRVNS